MPPLPTCACGVCRTCKNRIARRVYYRNHKEAVKRRTAADKRKRARADRSAEVSDEELDRRALILMGRMQPNA